MKKYNYKLDQACDAYYSQNGRPAPAVNQAEEKARKNLEALFEKYRSTDDMSDTCGVEGTMEYLTELEINLEDASFLIPLEIVQAPALGEMSKDGFVNGWLKAGAESKSVLDTVAKQKTYLNNLAAGLGSDPALFKRVYKHTFICSKDRGQKAIPLDNALVYWEMLFNPPGMEWKSKSIDWLQLWQEFLREKWEKTVNRDMWNQTLEFAIKSSKDDTMSFWSAEGAWPSVIDDFVVWVKAKNGPSQGGDKMETD